MMSRRAGFGRSRTPQYIGNGSQTVALNRDNSHYIPYGMDSHLERLGHAAPSQPSISNDNEGSRRRIAVACSRCRKRKIKCSGDLGNGQGCTNCKNAGSEECQFLRVNSTGISFGDVGYPYGSSIPLGTPPSVLNQCYPGSANSIAVGPSFPPPYPPTRAQQGYMSAMGQLDDGLPNYGINQVNYSAPYNDASMNAGLYKNPEPYSLWPVDVQSHRNPSIPENLRRASYAHSRYLAPSSSSTSASTDVSPFPSMAHLGNTLPVPRLPSSRPRPSLGSNAQSRSNGMEYGSSHIDMSQLQPSSGVKASTTFPWLDERLGDYLPSSQTASASLSGTNGATYAPVTSGLSQDISLAPHRPSYDFASQSYARNPSISQAADATESLTNLEQYSLSRHAPQPARSPSDHSSSSSISYDNGGPRNYGFLPSHQGNAVLHPAAGSVSGPYQIQESLATSLPPRNLSVASTSGAQVTSGQAYVTPRGLSRQASSRQLAAETSRHSISDASTDSSGK